MAGRYWWYNLSYESSLNKKLIICYFFFFGDSAGHQTAKEEDKGYKDTVCSFSHLLEILITEVLKHQIFFSYFLCSAITFLFHPWL